MPAKSADAPPRLASVSAPATPDVAVSRSPIATTSGPSLSSSISREWKGKLEADRESENRKRKEEQ